MKTYSVFDVANYFRAIASLKKDEGDLLSNLKLQKLCYYAQGVASIVRDAPLFNEPIQAWIHGPVISDLYFEYRKFGGGGIPGPDEDFDPSLICSEDQKLLDDIYDDYGQYSAWKLRDLTHEEAPWKNAYKRGANSVITLEALKEHFVNEVSEDYIAEYRGAIR